MKNKNDVHSIQENHVWEYKFYDLGLIINASLNAQLELLN